MNRILHYCLFLLLFSAVENANSANITPENQPFTALSDTTHPLIFCPGSQIVNLAPMRCDTILHYTVNGFDDQGQVILILLDGIASGGAFPSGVTVCTWLATDLAGNTATCSFTVSTFEPTTQPVCRDLTPVFLDQNCSKHLKAFEILEGGPYGCPIHYITEVDKTIPFGNGPWEIANFGPNDINQDYQVRVTSLLTNARCWGNIQVRDNLPPVLACQDINVPCALPESQLTPAFLRDSFGISTAAPIVNDGCSGSTLSISFVDVLQNLPCDDTTTVSGVIHRIWSATDAFGNTGTCEQVIHRNRLLANVQIPADKTANCNNLDLTDATNGRPFIQFVNRRYEITPASYCEFDLQYFDTIQPGNCAGNYTVRRTWKIYDACLPLSLTNPKVGVQKITVKDLTGPVIHCPADTIITVTDNNCRASIDLPDALVRDHCSALATFQAFWTDNNLSKTLLGAIHANPDTLSADSLGVMGIVASFPIGTTTMLYTAEDACGNTGDCTYRLTVANMTPPMAKCDALLLVGLPTNGYLEVPAAVLDNGSTDDCSQLAFKAKLASLNPCNTQSLFSDTLHICCHNSGDTLAGTLRVYDISMPPGAVSNSYGTGHYTDCTFKIKVSGTNAPSCTAPANITISCEAFDPTLESYGGLISQSCSVDSVMLTVNSANFDTMCSRGTITRNFKVFSNTGQTGQCAQKIVVDYHQDYFIRFPDDVILTSCDTSGIYGMPTFFGQDCELLNATFEDQQFNIVPDACYKIERTWRVVNWCTFDPGLPFVTIPNPQPNPITNHPDNLPGPVVSNIQTVGDPWKSAIVKINPTDATSTNYSVYYNPNANGYEYKQIIKVIDNQAPVAYNWASDELQVQDMTTNDPLLWAASYWFDPVLVSSDLCESPTDLSITASDGCAGGNVSISYQLLLDLNGDGLRETIINSTNLPPANTVYYNNSSGGPGEARAFDFRPVPVNQKWRFAMEEVVTGNKKTAYLRFNTMQTPNTFLPAQLPYGTHKIRWFITDACGNETACERTFRVRDGKAPTVICMSGITINLSVGGTSTIYATDILQYTQDNCTPTQYLVVGIRRAGTGTGFPIDGSGNAVTSLVFSCEDLGTQAVEIWSVDKYGNADFCPSNLIIQDNAGYCNMPPVQLAGQITTVLNEGISDVKVAIIDPNSAIPPLYPLSNYVLTDTSGNYLFGAQFSGLPINGLLIEPTYDANPLNGVTTFDLVLISKHILGIQALDSPYKIIAADANKSNTLTTFDIVELRKLLLGIYQALPNNTSWRFIDKAYAFPNQQYPFQPPFPETIAFNPMGGDFIGVKIGDVNNTAMPHATGPANDRSAGTLHFNVAANGHETVQAGELFEVTFTAEAAMLGCQFTLNTNGLEVLDIVPGADVERDHFALFPEKNALTMAWEKGGNATFTLKCKALEAGNIREMLSIGSRITKAEGYQNNAKGVADRFDLALRFPEMGTFELFQNHPNPFAGATEIAFNLPEASEATLKVFDTGGRILFTQTGNYDKGTHTITLEKAALDATGVLYYQLETPAHSAMRKMVRI